MNLLTCKNVKMGYSGPLVVDDVSFTLEEGDYLCVVGENGSGKSTLIKGVLGLLKPTGGEIAFHGIVQRQIGYLPQTTVVQKDFPASVYEIVLSGCLNRLGACAFYSKKEKIRANEMLKRMDMEQLRKTPYRELSSGQQQRVLLARALCATDKLLVLDEPVAGLDPKITEELYEQIQQLNRDAGISVLMVSHDIKGALRYANKILHMKTRAAFLGTAEAYGASDAYHAWAGGKVNG